MALRSIGSMTISFGLVSIPSKLYVATSPQSIGLHLLHERCGGRVKQQYVCPIDDVVVERSEMVRGYEFAKGQYVRFTDEELKSLEAERTGRLDIVQFVPEASVDLTYIEKTYYLGPDKGGDRAYKLLSDAMVRTARLAVGRLGTRGREQLVIVRPYQGGLCLHYVYYADEVRSMDDVERPREVSYKPMEEELADRLIMELSVDAFHPETFHDDYRERLLAAIEQKTEGHEVVAAPAAPQGEVIDLFDALKRSVEERESPRPGRARARSGRSAERGAGRGAGSGAPRKKAG